MNSIVRKNCSSIHSWVAWLLASLFYAYQYVLRVLPNIIMPEIMEKFHMDAALFGQMSGLYYIGYAGMHIPIGLMLDRLGPRLIMSLSAFCTVLGILPLIYTDIWLFPMIGRFLVGAGSSSAILGIFKIIRMNFPEEKFTRMLGISVTIGLIGAIYGGQPVNYLLHIFGWQHVLEIIMIIGFVIGVAMIILLPPSYHQDQCSKASFWSDIRSVLSNPIVLAVCFFAGLMVGPLEGFADVWGAEFLKAVYSYSDDVATGLLSFIFLGVCFGSPILSYIADKTHSYYGIIILSGFLMILGFFMLLTGMLSNSFLIMTTFIMIGVACSYQIPAIYKASTYVQEQEKSLTNAIANMIIMFFGYIFHGSIGYLMTCFWDGRIQNEIPIYTEKTYIYALSIIPISLIIGVLGYIAIVIKEKKYFMRKSLA